MKAGLESRLGIKIGLDHPTVPWIVKHGASTLTKYLIRDCGNTSFKIIKGRKCIEPAGEFGELVLFKPLATAAEKAHKESRRDRFVEGVYMGSDIRTGKNFIGTADGVFRANAIRQRPADERWSAKAVNELRGCPQNPVPGRDSFRIPSYVRPELEGQDPTKTQREFVVPEDAHPAVRGLYVRKEDIEHHGPSEGCKTCRMIVLGRAFTKPHTDKCRERFTQLLVETEKGKRRVDRTEERLVRETYRQSEKVEGDLENEKKKQKADEGEDMTVDPPPTGGASSSA